MEHLHSVNVADGTAPGIGGDLTIGNAVAAKRELLCWLDRAATTLDLSGVTHVDGAGLQLLLLVRREADRRGLQMAGVVPSPAVEAALGVARIGLDLRPLLGTRQAERPGWMDAA